MGEKLNRIREKAGALANEVREVATETVRDAKDAVTEAFDNASQEAARFTEGVKRGIDAARLKNALDVVAQAYGITIAEAERRLKTERPKPKQLNQTT